MYDLRCKALKSLVHFAVLRIRDECAFCWWSYTCFCPCCGSPIYTFLLKIFITVYIIFTLKTSLISMRYEMCIQVCNCHSYVIWTKQCKMTLYIQSSERGNGCGKDMYTLVWPHILLFFLTDLSSSRFFLCPKGDAHE